VDFSQLVFLAARAGARSLGMRRISPSVRHTLLMSGLVISSGSVSDWVLPPGSGA
jgi:hypothetical protein